MKKTINMILFVTALATASMLSCNSPDLVPEAPLSLEYSIIDGDTVKTKKVKNYKNAYDGNKSKYVVISWQDTTVTFKEPKLPKEPSKEPDLAKIKNNKDPELKGKPLKMLTVGGNLASGVRDGGYFNEGILTSFPNLLARQMRLKKFESPLFSKENYNGLGRQVPASNNISGGPFKKSKFADNNLAFTDYNKVNEKFENLELYKGDPDNYAMPFLTISGILTRYIKSEGSSGQAYSRLYPESNKEESFLDIFSKKKFDFFVFEFGNDEVFKTITNYGYAGEGALDRNEYIEREDIPEYEYINRVPSEIKLMREVFVPSEAKGVLMNIPNWLSAPYFVDSEAIRQALMGNVYRQEDINSLVRDRLFKKSAVVDSILSTKVPYIIKPVIDKKHPIVLLRDYLDPYIIDLVNLTINVQNDMVTRLAKRYSLPVADIKGLFEKVNRKEGFIDNFGSLITQENFFSSDSLYPSPLGNALITNEIIKAINAFYGLKIQEINTQEF
jgi:hypothetical protein